MEPVISSHSLILALKYHGQPFANGAVLDFARDPDHPHVLHVAADQTADSVYMSGYNNHNSDGWYPKTTINHVMEGQLYLP